jgi:hypothetical protein
LEYFETLLGTKKAYFYLFFTLLGNAIIIMPVLFF